MLEVQPWNDHHELPHLAVAGIRYTLNEDAEDRCYASFSGGRVAFWCEAGSYEIEIVHPTPFERLCWDICVNGGWCGGIVNGKPSHVSKLMPRTGALDAQEFAKLAIRADGWPEVEPLDQKHLSWLEGKFIEHLGSETVEAEHLRRTSPRPFEDAAS